MVLYRKYRPQTLNDLIGQVAVKQTLLAAIAKRKLAHAYLFCGPRGTGKTSTARILAKIINCDGETRSKGSTELLSPRSTDEVSSLKSVNLPCNKCYFCLSITDGTNLDLVEMDAASNRGIEDIRSLRENIKLAPTAAKKKVYIIDEVHMLTGEAFNALLKTLEEPPSHVLFILATTDVQKVPQTILSRVQKLEFKLASQEELIEALEKIVKSEKIDIDKEALQLLAKKAGGSFRDGVKLLDQLSSFTKITVAVITENLGTGNFAKIAKFLEYLAEKKITEALAELSSQLESGTGPKDLNLSVLDNLRNILLIKNGLGKNLVEGEVDKETYAVLEKLAAKFTLEELLKAVDEFQKAWEQSRFVSIPSLPLELATMKSAAKESIEEEGKLRIEEKNQQKDSSEANIKEEAIAKYEPAENDSADIQKISEKWPYVLETVRQYNFSLEALLRTAKVIECGEKEVVVEVPYSFHQRILEAPKSKDLLESIFADILERPVKVKTALGKKVMKKDDLVNIEPAADDDLVRLASEIFSSEG